MDTHEDAIKSTPPSPVPMSYQPDLIGYTDTHEGVIESTSHPHKCLTSLTLSDIDTHKAVIKSTPPPSQCLTSQKRCVHQGFEVGNLWLPLGRLPLHFFDLLLECCSSSVSISSVASFSLLLLTLAFRWWLLRLVVLVPWSPLCFLSLVFESIFNRNLPGPLRTWKLLLGCNNSTIPCNSLNSTTADNCLNFSHKGTHATFDKLSTPSWSHDCKIT